MNSTINICFIATDNYCKFIPVSIQSIWENTKSKVNYYIIGSKISIFNKNKLIRYINSITNSEIHFIDFDISVLDGLATAWFKNPMPYARFFAADLINVDKLLYLDLDIIINDDVKEIYNTDLKNLAVGFVADENLDCWKEHKEKLKIDYEHLFFNSGMILMDAIKMRNENIGTQLLELSRKRSQEFEYADQCAYNIFFSPNKYIKLDTSFNVQPKWTNDKITCHKGIHFTIDKPWEKIGVKYEEFFWKYARKTPYYEEFLQDLFYLNLPKNHPRVSKFKKLKYKILYKITIGKMRKKYKNKYKAAKGI